MPVNGPEKTNRLEKKEGTADGHFPSAAKKHLVASLSISLDQLIKIKMTFRWHSSPAEYL